MLFDSSGANLSAMEKHTADALLAQAESDARDVVEDMQDCPSITPTERAALAVLLALVRKLETDNAQLILELHREARSE